MLSEFLKYKLVQYTLSTLYICSLYICALLGVLSAPVAHANSPCADLIPSSFF